ncbi:sulfotransferase family protein [Actinocorallia lasiicapitis]
MTDVIGVGFGRTGTTSLKAALEQIGFGPCYHMFTVLNEPMRLAAWQRMLREGPDWSELDGFRSTLDWPAMTWWRELADAHPEAKAILTVRDPERWYASVARTVLWSLQEEPGEADTGWWHTELLPVMRELILERSLLGRTDREGLLDLFDGHITQVKAHIPADRLLVFDVADGWEPLCAFLDVPVPDGPFPHLNDAEGFRARHLEQRASR